MLDKKIKERTIHRAKIIQGQLGGLIKAVEKEIYCPKLLEQSRSIQRSLKSLDALILENHIKTHIKHQMSSKDHQDKSVKELMQIYNLSNK